MRTAIVLGAAVWPGGRPSPTLKRRSEHAAGLFLSGAVERIVLTGGIGRTPPSEAQAAREICRANGVPDSALFLEETSATTIENIAQALREHPFLASDNVTIVTDKYHAPRAMMTARAYGLNAQADCPPLTGTKRSRVLKSYLREIPAILFYFVKLRQISRQP